MLDGNLLKSHLETTHARELSELFRLTQLVDALTAQLGERDARIQELEAQVKGVTKDG